MQVQPPGAELPDAGMPVRAFEICTPSLGLGINVPASASFVRDQRSVVGICHLLCKGCIVLDRLEPVLDRESGAFELSKSFGEVMIGLLVEDEFRCGGEGHWRGAVMQEAVDGAGGRDRGWESLRDQTEQTCLLELQTFCSQSGEVVAVA